MSSVTFTKVTAILFLSLHCYIHLLVNIENYDVIFWPITTRKFLVITCVIIRKKFIELVNIYEFGPYSFLKWPNAVIIVIICHFWLIIDWIIVDGNVHGTRRSDDIVCEPSTTVGRTREVQRSREVGRV